MTGDGVDIKLPQWGMAMNEGMVTAWLVAPGDTVEEGQDLVEVEAAKTTDTVTALAAGVVGELLVAEGETVAVNTVLCTVLPAGASGAPATPSAGDEAGSAEQGHAEQGRAQAPAPSASGAPREPAREPSRSQASAGERVQVAPRARRLAREKALDLATVSGSGPSGRIVVADVEAAHAGATSVPDARAGDAASTRPTGGSADTGRMQIAPLARKLAKEAGLDLAGVTGTGPGGRIRPDDVSAAIAARDGEPQAVSGAGEAGPAAPTPAPALAATDSDVTSPAASAAATPATSSAPRATSGMRKVIARRMLESLQTTAQFTITTTADVTDFVAYRASVTGGRPSFADAVARAVALSLRAHPDVNVRFENGAIVPNEGVHVGMAVAVEGGLVVPVIRDADRLGLAALAARTRELVDAARGGSLSPADMSGGSISVTSLGGQGVDAFTPILNTPESAIVGVGRTRDVPTRYGEALVWRQELTLSLTLDHRAVDGYPGALFLARVVELLAQPRALA